MIHKVKTITYEVRSHGQTSTVNEKGLIEGDWDIKQDPDVWDKACIKKLIWHFQDVLRCMKQIEREKQVKKEKGVQDERD